MFDIYMRIVARRRWLDNRQRSHCERTLEARTQGTMSRWSTHEEIVQPAPRHASRSGPVPEAQQQLRRSAVQHVPEFAAQLVDLDGLVQERCPHLVCANAQQDPLQCLSGRQESGDVVVAMTARRPECSISSRSRAARPFPGRRRRTTPSPPRTHDGATRLRSLPSASRCDDAVSDMRRRGAGDERDCRFGDLRPVVPTRSPLRRRPLHDGQLA
jgi:hypothetical protein